MARDLRHTMGWRISHEEFCSQSRTSPGQHWRRSAPTDMFPSYYQDLSRAADEQSGSSRAEFLPTNSFEGAIPAKSNNSVVSDINFTKDDERPLTHQALVDIPLEDVVEVVNVKVSAPASSGHRTAEAARDHQSSGALTQYLCNWIRVNVFTSKRQSQTGEAREQVYRPVSADEADLKASGDVAEIGRKRKATSVEDGRALKRPHIAASSSRKYTAIDLCAGAGGVTIAAKAAGFHVTHTVDIDKICCQTLRLNHPEIKVIRRDVTEIRVWGSTLYADFVCSPTPSKDWTHY